jgi:hypothetical protein
MDVEVSLDSEVARRAFATGNVDLSKKHHTAKESKKAHGTEAHTEYVSRPRRRRVVRLVCLSASTIFIFSAMGSPKCIKEGHPICICSSDNLPGETGCLCCLLT